MPGCWHHESAGSAMTCSTSTFTGWRRATMLSWWPVPSNMPVMRLLRAAGVCHVAARCPEPCRSPAAEGRRQVVAQSRGWRSEAAPAPGQRLDPRHAGAAPGPVGEAAQPGAGAGEQLLSADHLATASRQTQLLPAWRYTAEGVQYWRRQPSGGAASELLLQACQRQTF